MPDFNFDARFLDSVGFEHESIFLQKETVQDRVGRAINPFFPNRRVLNVTRDASSEMQIEFLRLGSKLLQVSCHTKATQIIKGMGRDPRTIGYEFFTSPLSISDMEKFLYPAMFTLVQLGDSVTERAASHIHVGFAHNLRLLKRLLRICLAIDPVLFRLGGMGGTHRGWKNHAAYARPLLHPVVVPVMRENGRIGQVESYIAHDGSINLRRVPGSSGSSQFVKVINPIHALNAQSLDEFWACFGISSSNMTKYHPARYTGVNFFAILAHGTIEFRHPNASLDPQLIFCMIKFLRAMVDLSTVCTKEEILSFELVPSNVEISMGDAVEIISRIVSLCRKHDIENIPTDYEIGVMVSSMEKSRFVPLPETSVLTHVETFSLLENIATQGKLESVDTILPPNHVDIHNIQSRESSIFDSLPETV